MEEDVCEEYKSSLLDLTCNSKPLINMLTMLAEENIDQAPRIVRSIEEHLQKVPIEMKLPVLYLIDSIMKNVGGAYRALFTQNVVSNFCSVFEKGDEKMRMQLFKLRQTWAEIFPNKKLFGLDTRVKALDPAWPVMAKEPQQSTTIHVNPKFLEAKAVLGTVAPSSEGEQVQRMLLQKQQEFILLQRQKLQLELQMQQQQLKQKQEAEQLMKSLKSAPGGAIRNTLPPPPVPGGTPMRPQVLQPQTPMTARDPRLQQRLVPPPDFGRPPPNTVLPPALQPSSEVRTVASVPTPAQLEKTPSSPEKRSGVRGSAKDDGVSKSPPKKFRIPKTTDRKKSTEEGGKNGTGPAKTSPTKASPTKSRKANEDKDERHAHRSLTSSSASSPGRGGKKSRGKGNKSSKGEENIRPADVEKSRNAANSNNVSPAESEALQTGDVDMRIIPEKKRDVDVGSNGESPQLKKHKAGGEAVLGDFDYRKGPGANSTSQRGWAQYKATHPDEYKNPLRPARENMDGRDEDLRQLPPGATAGRGGASMGRGGFQGRGGGQPLVDRFGRPLFRRLMSDPRFRSHVGQGPGNDPNLMQQQQQRLQMERMLADPEAFLQQTEEQLRAGLINPDLHRELKAELEKLSQFRKSQPLLPLDWQRITQGPGFPWNAGSPFPGMNPVKELPPPSEPAPAMGSIQVDTQMRKVQFVDDTAVVLMGGTETRQIMFKGPPKRVRIDDMEPILLSFDGVAQEFVSKRTGKKRTIKFGAPLREIFLDGVPYSAQFDNKPVAIKTADGEVHLVCLEPPPPRVDIERRPPEHVLRVLGLHPEKLANTDSDLRSLPMELSKPTAGSEGENSMDVDMRVPPQQPPPPEATKDVDLRKPPDVEGSGAPAKGPWNSPQRGGSSTTWVPPPDCGFQPAGKESGGWVRYGNASEERPPPNNSWPQQPMPQPPQDPGMHQRWPAGPPRDWNSNFGGEFPGGPNAHGGGPNRGGNMHGGGYSVKEYPSYFREDFPHPQMHPHPLGVGDMTRPPGFMQPQFALRPPGFPPGGEAPKHMPPLAPPPGMGPPPPQGMLAHGPPMPPPTMPLPGTLMAPPGQAQQQQQGPPSLMPPQQPPSMGVPNVQGMSGTFPPTMEARQAAAPAQVVPPALPPALEVNVGELFSKLIAAGILKQSPEPGNGAPGSAAGEPQQQQRSQHPGHHHTHPSQKKRRRKQRVEHIRQEHRRPAESVPPLSFFKTDQLKVKHPGVISALHVGTQCASCGLRFTDEKCEKYRQHLDWHFRANRRDKDGARKAFSRKWFYEMEDWIQFEEIEDLEERARSFFEQQATVEQDQSSNSPVAIKSVPASGDETENTCAVCEEAFQLFWVEEEEEWHFRDAMRVENKVYHPACYEDFKRAAEAPSSPIRTEPGEEAQAEAVEKADDEKPMEVEGAVAAKEEVPDENPADKPPSDESRADEAPTEPMETEASPDGDAKDIVSGGELTIKDEKAGSEEMPDDPVVIVDNLGEFGVSLSDGERSGDDENKPPETVEPKVVVKGTGGIIMKVKAESIQAPASPAPSSAAAAAASNASDTGEAGADQPAQVSDEPVTDEDDFRPPTPDPRFQSLPPVQRGNELSGLCCIM
ncbi:pre-mRNA cleavage complex 2 protein Pcf11 isoform X4 [Ixodes scapularis]